MAVLSRQPYKEYANQVLHGCHYSLAIGYRWVLAQSANFIRLSFVVVCHKLFVGEAALCSSLAAPGEGGGQLSSLLPVVTPLHHASPPRFADCSAALNNRKMTVHLSASPRIN